MTRQIRLLTVRQPWAWALIHGCKDVENRSHKVSYKGLLAIHAGKADHNTLKRDDWKQFESEYFGKDVFADFDPSKEPRGAIIGVIEMVDCKPEHQVDSIWCDDPGNEDGWFAWLVQKPIALPEPIPYRGAQGLQRLPEHLAAELIEAWERDW